MRTCAILSAVFVCASAWSGGPVNQQSSFGSVVRVLAGLSTPQIVGEFRGTGTIIGNKNVGGQGWLTVLTADHVVSTVGARTVRRLPILALRLAMQSRAYQTGLKRQ